MPEITWIKLRTNMFDDEKIKLIERMPEGDGILIIWVKLLAYAGKVNCGGYIMINETIPLNIEQIAIIFNRPLEKVRYAIQILQGFGMLEVSEEETVVIKNWEKHQNIEGMEKVKIQNAERQKRHREKLKQQKLLENSNDDSNENSNENSNVTVTSHNATDIDKEKDKEKEKEKDKKNSAKNSHDTEIEQKFATWWATYNNKKNKPKALAAFKKVLKNHDYADLLAHTMLYVAPFVRGLKDKQFQQHPTTFLNGYDPDNDYTYMEGGNKQHEGYKQPNRQSNKQSQSFEDTFGVKPLF